MGNALDGSTLIISENVPMPMRTPGFVWYTLSYMILLA
jgi:hypothetical protein